MTVATNRPDGWPQATTVGYVNDGLTLYFLCGPKSQKAKNLARDDRISLTIDHDTSDPMAITGLSMAAHAHPVADATEVAKVLVGYRGTPSWQSRCSVWALLRERYPGYAGFPLPSEEIRIYRVVPTVISVIDYAKGFGHSELAVP